VKFWPLNPEAIRARKTDEGPVKGTTFTSFSWASLTSKAPGSATHGRPASDNNPIFSPSSKGFIRDDISSKGVCSFKM
jgi:hypothetical protein